MVYLGEGGKKSHRQVEFLAILTTFQYRITISIHVVPYEGQS